MTGAEPASSVVPRIRRATIIVAAAAAAATLMSLLSIWLLAVPSGPLVCPAVAPPPTNCRSDFRVGTGLVATVAIATVFALTVLVALRRPSWRLSAMLGVTLLAAAPLVGYVLVTGLPGFPLS